MLIQYEIKTIKTGEVKRKKLYLQELKGFVIGLRSRDLAIKEYRFEAAPEVIAIFKKYFSQNFYEVTKYGVILKRISDGVRRTKYHRKVNFEKTFANIYKRFCLYLKSEIFDLYGAKLDDRLKISDLNGTRLKTISISLYSDNSTKIFDGTIIANPQNLKHEIIRITSQDDYGRVCISAINRCFYHATAATRYYRKKHGII